MFGCIVFDLCVVVVMYEENVCNINVVVVVINFVVVLEVIVLGCVDVMLYVCEVLDDNWFVGMLVDCMLLCDVGLFV